MTECISQIPLRLCTYKLLWIINHVVGKYRRNIQLVFFSCMAILRYNCTVPSSSNTNQQSAQVLSYLENLGDECACQNYEGLLKIDIMECLILHRGLYSSAIYMDFSVEQEKSGFFFVTLCSVSFGVES